MRKVFKDMLTDGTNENFDLVSIICLLSYIIYFTLSANSALNGHSFSGMDFSGGIGTMAVGFGINFKLAK
jgi:hypothetical protein